MKEKALTLVTARLVLAPIEEKDRGQALSLFSDSAVKKTYMLPDFYDETEANHFIDRIIRLTASPGHYSYGIFLEGSLIGFINDVCIEGSEIEIGYFISSLLWNEGYASEAFASLIEELFRVGFHSVVAAHFEENPASGAVMKKCGLTLIDRTEEIEYRGKTHHCIYYRIEAK